MSSLCISRLSCSIHFALGEPSEPAMYSASKVDMASKGTHARVRPCRHTDGHHTNTVASVDATDRSSR